MSGILLVDKPQTLTSHDVIARVRRIIGMRRVGHAGTLDPLATGLLLIGVGPATRLLHYLTGLDKEYLATIRLGTATVTDDAEGEPVFTASPGQISVVTDAAIREGIAALTGTIKQVPSAVSAVKVDGERSYARVRAGKTTELAARTITISEFELLRIHRSPDAIELDVRVACSAGSYIRALARDLGSGLEIGGHVTKLRRTRVGRFGIDQAVTLTELEEVRSAGAEDIDGIVLSPGEAATRALAAIRVTDDEAVALGHGKRVPRVSAPSGAVAAVSEDERLVAIVEHHEGALRVLTGFPDAEPTRARS